MGGSGGLGGSGSGGGVGVGLGGGVGVGFGGRGWVVGISHSLVFGEIAERAKFVVTCR